MPLQHLDLDFRRTQGTEGAGALTTPAVTPGTGPRLTTQPVDRALGAVPVATTSGCLAGPRMEPRRCVDPAHRRALGSHSASRRHVAGELSSYLGFRPLRIASTRPLADIHHTP